MTCPVLIVGAGGWGREVLVQMQDDPACGRDWQPVGFLDTRQHLLDGLDCDLAIVGSPIAYQPRAEERFVCAIGDPYGRERYARPLLEQGARFISIHSGAYVSPRVHIGHGCFLSHRAQISPDVWLGDFSNVHSSTILGHDVRVGRYAQIGAMTFIGGGAHVGDYVTIHPHATILRGISIGEGAVVGAGSVVVKDVPNGASVFGNPAKLIFSKDS